MEGLFAKTEKGYAEVEHKTAKLSHDMRRVLIFVNGQRHINELMTLPCAGKLHQILNDLAQAGYISRIPYKAKT